MTRFDRVIILFLLILIQGLKEGSAKASVLLVSGASFVWVAMHRKETVIAKLLLVRLVVAPYPVFVGCSPGLYIVVAVFSCFVCHFVEAVSGCLPRSVFGRTEADKGTVELLHSSLLESIRLYHQNANL